jgi:transcription antitermination protein NusB
MKRHELRARAVQAIYQMDVGQVAALEAVGHVLEGDESTLLSGQRDFVTRLVQGVGVHTADLDELIATHVTGWRLDRIAKVDLAVLRLALYELLFEAETDVATIMDEAVELAKQYSTEESGRFINGALAKLLPVVSERRTDSES